MRICITAGGTLEKIDDVRNIKNTSTGRLGQIIADMIPIEHEVDYVFGVGAHLPKRNINKYSIESVSDLDKTMTDLLSKYHYDVVIFAAAVSDYMIRSVTTFENLGQKLHKKDHIKDLLYAYDEDLNRNEKITSDKESLAVLMVKAPKVISKVKKMQADTTLIGFKLLVDASEDELVEAAHKVVKNSQADYVLANDLLSIQGDKHTGHLIDETGILKTMNTKQEIAKAILERLKI